MRNNLFKIERIDNVKPHKPSIKRKASKAIIIQSGKLLMMQSKYGDYKFPGGGLFQKKVMLML